MAEINTLNRCAIGLLGAQVRILMPRGRMSAAEALTFAAYLVTTAEVADPSGPAFADVLEAVRRGD